MARPFKETKLGQFLGNTAPHILDKVGDILPDKGLLGIVKNLIDKDDKMTPEQKAEFHRLENEFALELIKDTQNARGREADFVKATGHIDWFMTVFGAVILLLFVYTVWVSSTASIPVDMREIFIESRAAVRDIVLAIAAYYWGSSAGSRIKDMRGK